MIPSLTPNHEVENLAALIIAEQKAKETQETLTKEFDERLAKIRPITDPQEIISLFQSEIDASHIRLYGGGNNGDGGGSNGEKGEPSQSGWLKKSESAASYLRIWITLIVSLFIIATYFELTGDSQTNMAVLRSSLYLILIVTPFLLFANKVRLDAKEELIRLHSLQRDRNILLFWTAQTSDVKNSMFLNVMKHMSTNSTADISLRMIDRPFFRQKSKRDTITDDLADIKELLKNLTPTKSE